MSLVISPDQARRLWIRAQRLDHAAPFGNGGAKATQKAVEHLGYVQIDTINVIERCHHHILFSRIPEYQRQDLQQAQTAEKTVFEYWTHALSYVPTRDFRFYMSEMKRIQREPGPWLKVVKKEEFSKVLKLIRQNGPVSIRDIKDDVLVEKTHAWGSRKPSKKALSLGFYTGRLMISERLGMLKKYDLAERHFQWAQKPKAASEKEIREYLLERSLRSQALVSLESICHLEPSKKPVMRALIEKKVLQKELIPIHLKGFEKNQHWIRPEDFESSVEIDPELVHILSPFDPLIIQRKRLKAFFDYDHLFEAYVPPKKRVFGYFALPVLVDGRIVAALDLKTDRAAKKLLMQKWSWIGKSKSASLKQKIEKELGRFEKFQMGS